MSRKGSFRFRAITPRPWIGRYRRVPGDTTVFHVRWLDDRWWPVVDWVRGDELGTCRMTSEGDASRLAEAVNLGKAAQRVAPGGAFLVDEYGRVLVPGGHATDHSVYVVGECSGSLQFENPFDPGTVFDLYDDTGLEIGDAWNRPYVGVQYQLSKYDELYFWEENQGGAQKLTPPAQDGALVEELRGIRPYGAVRFLLGPGGVVVTKVPPLWEPRYAGRLNLATWFAKEALE